MKYTRRHILRTGIVAGAASLIPAGRLRAVPVESRDIGRLSMVGDRPDPAVLKMIALRAIDAAKRSGAQYADVRVTRSTRQALQHPPDRYVSASVADMEHLGIGIRTLADHAWGFAASPYWDTDEADVLAKTAVAQAKSNARNGARVIDLIPASIETGEWVAPAIDPFTISLEEKMDLTNGWRIAAADYTQHGIQAGARETRMNFDCQEQCVATTEGTLVYQRFYSTEGRFELQFREDDWPQPEGITASGLENQQGGWETLINARLVEQIPQLFDYLKEEKTRQVIPVEVGRYDVVFDAKTACRIIGATLGRATQIDYALGFEANAGGTSAFFPDPAEHAGIFRVGVPSLNVMGNRSLPRGCATAQWDAEGVRTQDFSLVKGGVLHDFQTTRETAGELRSSYDRRGIPVQSRGCAKAGNAIALPILSCANLTMTPDTNTETFESLVRGIRKGVAVTGAGVVTDFQGKTAWGGSGEGIREIVDGKLGRTMANAGFLFPAFDFWKSVTAICGPGTEKTVAIPFTKGEPGQSHSFTVSAVPFAVKDFAIIDPSRRS